MFNKLTVYLVILSSVVAFGFLYHPKLFRPYTLKNSYMEPNYHQGSTYRTRAFPADKLRRGDVVLAHYEKTTAPIISRVTGLPGDKIKITGGQVVINNSVLSEPYLAPNTTTQAASNMTITERNPDGCKRWNENEEFVVPPSSYFLLGDNREASLDSRCDGFVKHDRISGVIK